MQILLMQQSNTFGFVSVLQNIGKKDNPACRSQQMSQEGNVMTSLIHYQRKAQPAPSV